MPNLACPVCGTEYAGWSVRCPSCGTALEAAALDVDPNTLTEDEKVVYELGEWPLEVQAEAAQVMAESGIPHAWDDTDLVIHLAFEEQVDALLEEVEREAIASGQLEPSGEGEAEEGDEIVYDLSDWGEPDRRKLDGRLDEGGVPHVWEGTSLVVAATDEALVEELLDGVEHPDALAAEPDDTEEAEEDEVRHELLSDLFDAADRLKRDAEDERGIEELTEVLAEADADRPPYGFPPVVWRTAVGLAGELGDLLVVAAGGALDGDDESDDDESDSADDDAADGADDAVSGGDAGSAGEEDGEGESDGDGTGDAASDAGGPGAGIDPEEAVERKATELRDLLRPYV